MLAKAETDSIATAVDRWLAQFERALSEAGLFVERYLTPDGTWVAASPRN